MNYAPTDLNRDVLPVWAQAEEVGTKMIMHELRVDYETANKLLLTHGSVRKAVDAERNKS